MIWLLVRLTAHEAVLDIQGEHKASLMARSMKDVLEIVIPSLALRSALFSRLSF
jgi:hypothetical protein